MKAIELITSLVLLVYGQVRRGCHIHNTYTHERPCRCDQQRPVHARRAWFTCVSRGCWFHK
jgi:hypothetical protein